MASQLSLKEVKSRTDGDEMDLSVMEMVKIPVKVIASVPKVTNIDFSCNRIQVLPDIFCTSLKNLVILDLSKNQLTELPSNIGLMTRLKKLDLYHNKLQVLPVGFSQLTSLRWLDLKDNPLNTNLKKIVGDCLDEAGCKQCAKSVVSTMKEVNTELERQRQQQLQAQKQMAEKKRRQEELEAKIEREQRNEEKRKEKELRRRKWEETHGDGVGKKSGKKNEKKGKNQKEIKKLTYGKIQEEKKSTSCLGWLIYILFMTTFFTFLLYAGTRYYCTHLTSSEQSEEICSLITSQLEEIVDKSHDMLAQSRVILDETYVITRDVIIKYSDIIIHNVVQLWEETRSWVNDVVLENSLFKK